MIKSFLFDKSHSTLNLASLADKRVSALCSYNSLSILMKQISAFRCHGFTLIELSIVLVIIGLIVGGILVGRDLIISSEIRSQISQISSTMTAINTFKVKYNFLPGDLPASAPATPSGGATRSCWDGATSGNGNGLIEPSYNTMAGEPSMLWNDLSAAKLIKGSYTYILPTGACDPGHNLASETGAAITKYLPRSMFGANYYLYIWSGGVSPFIFGCCGTDGKNYIGIAEVNDITGYNGGGAFKSYPTLPVYSAYMIDTKMDDGLPQTGNALASYYSFGIGGWSGAAGTHGSNDQPNTNATAGSSSTCYDNNNINGAVQSYSISQNNGTNRACALSLRFQ